MAMRYPLDSTSRLDAGQHTSPSPHATASVVSTDACGSQDGASTRAGIRESWLVSAMAKAIVRGCVARYNWARAWRCVAEAYKAEGNRAAAGRCASNALFLEMQRIAQQAVAS